MKDDQPKKTFYQAHLFFCVNRRPDDHPHGSCAAEGSADLFDFMKERAHEMGLEGVHGGLDFLDPEKRPPVREERDGLLVQGKQRLGPAQQVIGHRIGSAIGRGRRPLQCRL